MSINIMFGCVISLELLQPNSSWLILSQGKTSGKTTTRSVRTGTRAAVLHTWFKTAAVSSYGNNDLDNHHSRHFLTHTKNVIQLGVCVLFFRRGQCITQLKHQIRSWQQKQQPSHFRGLYSIESHHSAWVCVAKSQWVCPHAAALYNYIHTTTYF